MEDRTGVDWSIASNHPSLVPNVMGGDGGRADDDLLTMAVNPWTTTPEDHWENTTNPMGPIRYSFNPDFLDSRFQGQQLGAEFNQLTLSSPSPVNHHYQSGLSPITGDLSTVSFNDHLHRSPARTPYQGGGNGYPNGYFRAIGFGNPAMGGGGTGGYNVSMGGSPGSLSPCYPGTHHPNGYLENFLDRMRVQSDLRGRGRGMNTRPIYEEYRPHSNPNPNRSLDSLLYSHPQLYNSNPNQRGRSSRGFENRRSLLLYNNRLPQCSSNFSSMEQLTGNVYLLARNQLGCQNLQKIFDEGQPEKIAMIFSEVKEHAYELMKDQFGNLLIQNMFDVCNARQIYQFLVFLLSDERRFLDVCVDIHGTRAVQKLLEFLTTEEQKYLALSCLRRITLSLTKDANGYRVLERCFDHFPLEDTKEILNVVADNCMEIAMDKSGCCLLQHCGLDEEVEPLDRIVAEITANALQLSAHCYGNYVVQYIVGLKMERATGDVVAQLSGNFAHLSLDKYGSNVVEKCINFCAEDTAMGIIEEVIHRENFVALLQDRYGNYVAQSAFKVSKGSTRNMMLDLIQKNFAFLHSHPYGKRVLDKIGRVLYAPTRRGRNRMRYDKA